MVLIPAKQVRKFIDAPVIVENFEPSGADDNITAALTALLATAGDGGRSVPVQPATTGMGVVLGRCRLRYTNPRTSISWRDGFPVHGELAHSNGTFTIAYFDSDWDGIANTVSTPRTGLRIDIEVLYRFDFDRLPASALRPAFTIDEYVSGTSQGQIPVTVTGVNTFAPFEAYGVLASGFMLAVNGMLFDQNNPDPSFSVDVNARTITWNPANAGFDIEPGDRVIALFSSPA